MKPEILLEQTLAEFPELKERLLKLYDTPERVLNWLGKPKWQLNGKTPEECLDSDFEAIVSLLNQIERGDFS
ncbi:hypothetical protein ACHSBP_19455 [Pseudoalteromonas sp. XMcav1-K]|uniref:hypothetical protein n=1 Tax=Pseudoalteromonas sp. XMcav1-K TaxID=3374372 RepID=UPI003757562E